VHHEVEILVKINKVGKYIDAKFAHKYYDEIGLGIDFTARDVQAKLKEKGLPWEKAKAFDGSAVIGDFIPKTEFGSLENINFELTNNGAVVQKGNTAHMLWKIDEIIAYVSQYFTLKTGDIIFTGTPEGVAKVNPDDVLEGSIEGRKLFKVQVK
jgi:2-keto-4-pentenoate hydratase/2-oxohepta-3-ene-1,7-dioic acid hydratase in catechol pathway